MQFLRRTASIRIFVSHAPQPELLCLDRLPPRKSGKTQFFLWNTDYPWTPDIAVASNGASYIRDIDSAPVIEYDRDPLTLGCYDKDRSANGTSASVGLAGRSTRSNRRSWLGRMRPDRGGAAELPIHAQGRICLVGADRP